MILAYLESFINFSS